MNQLRSPLHFFADLILYNGFEKLWIEFEPSKQEKIWGFSADRQTGVKVSLYLSEDGSILDEDFSDFYSDFLIPKFRIECTVFREQIHLFCLQNSLSLQQNFLRENLRRLKYLFDKIDTHLIHESDKYIAKKYLKFIDKFLNRYYGTNITLSDYEIKDPTFTFKPSLKVMQLVRKIIDNLNDRLDNGFLENSANEFLELIFLDKVIPGEKRIVFKCTTEEAAYILHSLKSLIPKLSWRNIERSQSFFSKIDGKNYLKETNLSKSYREFLKKNETDIIDNIFKE